MLGDLPICTHENCEVVMRSDMNLDGVPECPICYNRKWTRTLSSLTREQQDKYNRNSMLFFMWRGRDRHARRGKGCQ